MKRIILIALVLVLVVAVPVSAATTRVSGSIGLSFNGTTAFCSGSVTDVGNYIDATLELWEVGVLIDSWPMSGISGASASGTATVSHGETYTLLLYGTSGGVSFPPKSVTKTCP